MKSLKGILLAFVIASPLRAQALDTRTIDLRHLKPAEAVRLLMPYIRSPGGGVFDVSEKIPIITVRDTPENIAVIEKVLAKYDHSPATIRLVFQLIEADTGPKTIPAANERAVSSDLDATLRSVLRFSSYRMLAQGVATSGEFSDISQQLANADANTTYDIFAQVGAIRLSDATLQAQATTRLAGSGLGSIDTSATGSVHLNVSLFKRGSMYLPRNQNGMAPTEGIMSTGLDVPLGSTVVLGTATTQKSGVALILTVKPELVRSK